MEEPNPTKTKRYVYNPYLLNVLYQKAVFLEKIQRRYWLSLERRGVKRELNEKKERVIKKNFCAELLVADVYYLMEGVGSDKFPFDIYHCNYEYILFRMLSIFHPPTESTISSDLCLRSQPFISELSCSVLVEKHGDGRRDENCRILSRLIERYIDRYYFLEVGNENEASKRALLLANLKRSTEETIKTKQYDSHYRVNYDGAVIVTLMYRFFMNEFRSLLMSDYSLLSLTEASDSPQLADLNYQLGLIEALDKLLRDQYDNEFTGYALVEVHPEEEAVIGEEGEEEIPMIRRYSNPFPINQTVLISVKDQENGQFRVEEKKCTHIEYISLKKYPTKYVRIMRRIIFDHELLELHRTRGCLLEGCDEKQRKKSYTLHCHICSYFQTFTPFHDFYEHSSSLSYNVCYYTHHNNKQLDNENLLKTFLSTLLIDRVPPVIALIYKNAWQVARVFYAYEEINLFHIIHPKAFIDFVGGEYATKDGGPEQRLGVILSSRTTGYHMDKQEKQFINDIDMMNLFLHAVNEQVTEIDKYYRTVALAEKSFKSGIHSNVIARLHDLYQFYCRIAGIDLLFHHTK